MRLAVLNPGGNDPEQPFPNGAGVPGERGHAPVNYHAYAACTEGAFYRDAGAIATEHRHVLLLLRRDLRACLDALRRLAAGKRTVVVSWKESGPYQIAAQLDSPGAQALFREVCALAHGAIASTPEAALFYTEAGVKRVEFIPTPYPVDCAAWDFSRPLAGREGIFIGTREWDVPTRRHELAVREAVATGLQVTVVNDGKWLKGWLGRRRLVAMGISPRRILRRMPYPDYLKAMARCRVVFQRDCSAVPGQVAGDALLCRMPCVGGNGAVDREAFGELLDLRTLMQDDEAWHAAVADSQRRAAEKISFAAVAEQLRAFFAACAG